MYSKLLRHTTALGAKSARASFLRRQAPPTLRFRLLQQQRRQPPPSLSQQYGVSQRRLFASEASQQGGGGGNLFWYLAIATLGGAGVAYYQQYPPLMDLLGLSFDKKAVSTAASTASTSVVDYKKVRERVADIMDDFDYDEGVGSYGPVFVRLAWHSSGTYDKNAGNGGSNGATMRFAPESEHGANAGLHVARDKLEEVKKEFPGISYGDLWTLASVVAIEEMGGPKIPWRAGRTDAESKDACPPDGRLPDGDKGAQHMRDIFYKMGFNDQEITALVGAHALGKCHKDRSGFDGLWTRSPTTFSNEFYKLILNEKWTKRVWDGPLQYENPEKDLMMLEADLAFARDPKFRKWSEVYASDQAKWHEDFSAAYAKLLELNCSF